MKAIADTSIDLGKVKKGFVRVYRMVYLDRISDLSLDNLGVHWTTNFQYFHKGGNDKGVCPNEGATKKVKVMAIVSVASINKEATAFSNEQYPKECEVVLSLNTEVQIEIIVSEKALCGAWMRATEFYAATANTGTRCDKWIFNPYN